MFKSLEIVVLRAGCVWFSLGTLCQCPQRAEPSRRMVLRIPGHLLDFIPPAPPFVVLDQLRLQPQPAQCSFPPLGIVAPEIAGGDVGINVPRLEGILLTTTLQEPKGFLGGPSPVIQNVLQRRQPPMRL